MIDWEAVKSKNNIRTSDGGIDWDKLKQKNYGTYGKELSQRELQNFSMQSALSPSLGQQIVKKNQSIGQELKTSTEQDVKKNPLITGILQGSTYGDIEGDIERVIGQQLDIEDAKKTGLYKTGEVLGTIGQFASGYSGAGGTVAKGASKLIPKATKPLAKKIATEATKDLTIGTGLSTIQGAKSDLKGKELAKNVGQNLVIDLLTGGGFAVGGKIYKSVKALKSATPKEIDKVVQTIAKQTETPIEEVKKQVDEVLTDYQKAYRGEFKYKTNITTDEVIDDYKKAYDILKARSGTTIGERMWATEIVNNLEKNLDNAGKTVVRDAKKPTLNPNTKPKGFGENTVGAAQYDKSMETPDELPISKFRTNTIERATDIPQDVKNQLDFESFDFVPETKAEWQEVALKNIEVNRDEVINNIKNAKSISGGVQAHEAAIISKQLLEEAQTTGDYSKYKEFLQTVSDKTRETARALKGTDTAWDKESADGLILKAQRVVDGVEEELKKTNPKLVEKVKTETKQKIKEFSDLGQNPNPKEVEEFIKKKYGIPTIDDSDIQFIIKKMKESKQFPEGSYENRAARQEILNRIANKVPATLVEKVQALQRIAMLLNPKSTMVRNPLGNTLLGGLESIKNIPATALDKAISLKTGKRTTTINPLVKGQAEVGGMAQGLTEWAKDLRKGIDTSPTGGQADLPHKTKIFSENHNVSNEALKQTLDTVGKIGNGTHQVVAKMLQLGDRPFYQGAYNSRIAELKLLNKTDKITPEMEQQAREYALERTFQNDSWLAKKFLKIGADKTDPAIWRILAHLIMPFKKTPANILDKFIDYSGVGGVSKAFYHLGTTAKKGTFNQKYFVDTMARGLTGGGLVTLGYLLAKNGYITGGRDKNNKIEGIETALGKQNYAFKIGNNYHTYDWALPASAPLALGADYFYAESKAKDGQNAALKGIESSVNLLFNSTLLQGPSRLMGGYSPAASIGQTLLGTTSQFSPTGGKQLAQLIDPYVRETYDPNILKQTVNKTKARIPGLSLTLPKKQDVFGKDVKAFQGKNTPYNVLLNPGFTTEYKPNSTQKEIIRLYEESGLTEQLPAVVEKYINATKEHPKINLTSEEYVQYQKQTGQLTLQLFGEEMKKQAYKNATDEEKARVLNKIVRDAKAKAKQQILEKRGYK